MAEAVWCPIYRRFEEFGILPQQRGIVVDVTLGRNLSESLVQNLTCLTYRPFQVKVCDGSCSFFDSLFAHVVDRTRFIFDERE
jgi:hypothetical protein